MTHPSPSFIDAIAEICKWHSRVELTNPSRKLRDGGRQAILPPEIPDAIRKGEIEVPESLIKMIVHALLNEPIDQLPDIDLGKINWGGTPRQRHPPGAID